MFLQESPFRVKTNFYYLKSWYRKFDLWRRRVEVESTIRAAKDRITGFEGRESHRTLFASVRKYSRLVKMNWTGATYRCPHDCVMDYVTASTLPTHVDALVLLGHLERSGALRRGPIRPWPLVVTE